MSSDAPSHAPSPSLTTLPGSWPRFRQLWSQYGLGDVFTVFLLGMLVLIIDNTSPHMRVLSAQELQSDMYNFPLLDSIVSNTWLFVISILLPTVVMLVFFYFRFRQPGSLIELRVLAVSFAATIFLTMSLTRFGKKYTGEARPNFVQATGYDSNTGTYSHPEAVSDAFQGFPSGHASRTFAGLGFLSLYLYYNLYCFWRLGGREDGDGILVESGLLLSERSASNSRSRRDRWDEYASPKENQLWLLILCFSPLWLALYVALTRVRDYHHFYADITAGAALGMAMAVAGFKMMYLARKGEWRNIGGADAAAESSAVGEEQQISTTQSAPAVPELQHTEDPLTSIPRGSLPLAPRDRGVDEHQYSHLQLAPE
jgi:diacylglycerol diphosphate phosphatase/phosphatidate phosphatase